MRFYDVGFHCIVILYAFIMCGSILFYSPLADSARARARRARRTRARARAFENACVVIVWFPQRVVLMSKQNIFWGLRTKFIFGAVKHKYLISEIIRKATCYETQQIHEFM